LTDFAIHTTLNIEDMERICSILMENLNGLSVNELKNRIELYEKVSAVVKQFHENKEIV